MSILPPMWSTELLAGPPQCDRWTIETSTATSSGRTFEVALSSFLGPDGWLSSSPSSRRVRRVSKTGQIPETCAVSPTSTRALSRGLPRLHLFISALENWHLKVVITCSCVKALVASADDSLDSETQPLPATHNHSYQRFTFTLSLLRCSTMSPIMTDDSLAARVKDWDIRAAQNTIAPEVRTKNRRKRYLDLHPEYFGPQLELAGALLLVQR